MKETTVRTYILPLDSKAKLAMTYLGVYDTCEMYGILIKTEKIK